MSKKPGLRTRLARALARLNNPKDTQAAWAFAALLLAGEAVLCALIIWRVPCESGCQGWSCEG